MNRAALFVAWALLGASMLGSRRAYAMTDVEAQDTSYAPREADFNPEVNLPVLPPIWTADETDTNSPSPPAPSPPSPSYDPGTVAVWDDSTNQVIEIPADRVQDWWEGTYIPFESGYGDWTNPPPSPSPTPALPPYVPFEDGYPVSELPDAPTSDDGFVRQMRALQYVIRSCEHLYPQNVTNGRCYRIFYSGQRNYAPALPFLNQMFDDFSDHPIATGECKAVPLSPEVCQAAGLNPGCVSTAAGAYQIIKPIWNRLRKAHPELVDFSPEMQDLACEFLLEDCGALAALRSGDFPGAVTKASKVWASLPGSTAKQSPKDRAFALARFNEALGVA